jgi:hypothetical protein
MNAPRSGCPINLTLEAHRPGRRPPARGATRHHRRPPTAHHHNLGRSSRPPRQRPRRRCWTSWSRPSPRVARSSAATSPTAGRRRISANFSPQPRPLRDRCPLPVAVAPPPAADCGAAARSHSLATPGAWRSAAGRWVPALRGWSRRSTAGRCQRIRGGAHVPQEVTARRHQGPGPCTND